VILFDIRAFEVTGIMNQRAFAIEAGPADGSRRPSENEPEAARLHGEQMAKMRPEVVCIGRSPISPPVAGAQDSVEIEGRADERNARERLRKIPDSLSPVAGFFGIKSQVICISERVHTQLG